MSLRNQVQILDPLTQQLTHRTVPNSGAIKSGRTSTIDTRNQRTARGGKYNRQGGNGSGAVNNWSGWAPNMPALPKDLALSSYLPLCIAFQTAVVLDIRVLERAAGFCLSSNRIFRLKLHARLPIKYHRALVSPVSTSIENQGCSGPNQHRIP